MAGTRIEAPVTSTLNLREINSAGLALTASCTGTPPTTANTFAVGCLITQTDATAGQPTSFFNIGTAAAPIWAADPNGSLVAQTTLSSAQILALNATPVSLVAAPGVGRTILVENITFKMITTATAYANGGAVEFRYTNASGAKVVNDVAAAVVTAGAGTTYSVRDGLDVTAVDNAAIVVDNATAAFITGTGTAQVTVKYRIVTP